MRRAMPSHALRLRRRRGRRAAACRRRLGGVRRLIGRVVVRRQRLNRHLRRRRIGLRRNRLGGAGLRGNLGIVVLQDGECKRSVRPRGRCRRRGIGARWGACDRCRKIGGDDGIGIGGSWCRRVAGDRRGIVGRGRRRRRAGRRGRIGRIVIRARGVRCRDRGGIGSRGRRSVAVLHRLIEQCGEQIGSRRCRSSAAARGGRLLSARHDIRCYGAHKLIRAIRDAS